MDPTSLSGFARGAPMSGIQGGDLDETAWGGPQPTTPPAPPPPASAKNPNSPPVADVVERPADRASTQAAGKVTFFEDLIDTLVAQVTQQEELTRALASKADPTVASSTDVPLPQGHIFSSFAAPLPEVGGGGGEEVGEQPAEGAGEGEEDGDDRGAASVQASITLASIALGAPRPAKKKGQNSPMNPWNAGLLLRKGTRVAAADSTIYTPGIEREESDPVLREQITEEARAWPSEPVVDWFQRIKRETDAELSALRSGAGAFPDAERVTQNPADRGRPALASHMWKLLLHSQEDKQDTKQAQFYVLKRGAVHMADQAQTPLSQDDEVFRTQAREFAYRCFTALCRHQRISGKLDMELLQRQLLKPREEIVGRRSYRWAELFLGASLLDEDGKVREITEAERSLLGRIKTAGERFLESLIAITTFMLNGCRATGQQRVLPLWIKCWPFYGQGREIASKINSLIRSDLRPDYYHPNGRYFGKPYFIPWDTDELTGWSYERWMRYIQKDGGSKRASRRPVAEPRKLPAAAGAASNVELAQALQGRPAPAAASSGGSPPVQPERVGLVREAVLTFMDAPASEQKEKTKKKRAKSSSEEEGGGGGGGKKSRSGASAKDDAQRRKRGRDNNKQAAATAAEEIRVMRERDADQFTRITEPVEATASTFVSLDLERLEQLNQNLRITPGPRGEIGSLGPITIIKIIRLLRNTDLTPSFEQFWDSEASADRGQEYRAYWLRVANEVNRIESAKRLERQREQQQQQPVAVEDEQPAQEPVPEAIPEARVPVSDIDMLAQSEPPLPLYAGEAAERNSNSIGTEFLDAIAFRNDLLLRESGRVEEVLKSLRAIVRRGLRSNRLDSVPVSIFCLVVPWRVLHNAVSLPNDASTARPAPEPFDFSKVDESLSGLLSVAQKYVRDNLEAIYRYYYACVVVAARDAPRRLLFQTWMAQFTHYVLGNAHVLRVDRKLNELVEAPLFHRGAYYPRIPVFYCVATLAAQGRWSVKGAIAANDFEAVFGSGTRDLGFAFKGPNDTRYCTLVNSSSTGRVLLVEGSRETIERQCKALVNVEFSPESPSRGSVELTHLQDELQLAGALEFGVVMCVIELTTGGSAPRVRQHDAYTFRPVPNATPVHSITRSVRRVLAQESSSYALRGTLLRWSPGDFRTGLATGCLAIDLSNGVSIFGGGIGGHPIFSTVRTLIGDREAPEQMDAPAVNAPPGSLHLLVLISAKLEYARLFVYRSSANRNGKMIRERDLDEQPAAAGMRSSLVSILCYRPPNGFVAEFTPSRWQPSREYTLAPRSLVTRDRTRGANERVLLDAVIICDADTNFSYSSTLLEPPQAPAPERAAPTSMDVGEQLTLQRSVVARCEACGRDLNSAQAPRSFYDTRGVMHRTCSERCSQELISAQLANARRRL